MKGYIALCVTLHLRRVGDFNSKFEKRSAEYQNTSLLEILNLGK